MTGTQVIGALGVVVLATVVVPPLAAWQLNTRRVEQTRVRVEDAADALRTAVGVGVWCGPGERPDAPAAKGNAVHESWVTHAVPAPEHFGGDARPDAWGHCLLFDGVPTAGSPAWVLSAGPNGVVDTPRGERVLQGDDIGVVVVYAGSR